MKKRFLAILAALALLLCAVPMLAVSAVSDPVWKQGNMFPVTDPGFLTYEEWQDGYYWLRGNDVRGYIDGHNLDEGPFYMAMGTDGRHTTAGNWIKVRLSNGERNSRWCAVGDIALYVPNFATDNWIIENYTATNQGVANQTTVPFMSNTAYVFKFAKEQNDKGEDVLAVYINGVRVYEGAKELDAFNGDQLHFITMTNEAGTATSDSAAVTPIFINPNLGNFQEPESYFVSTTKGGLSSDPKKYFNKDDMFVLYNEAGYAYAMMNCRYDDAGGGGEAGESIATDFVNPNKNFDVIVNPYLMYSGNWNVLGIYNPANGIKTPSQDGGAIRVNFTSGDKLGVYYYWGTQGDQRIQFADAKSISWRNDNKIRFELVEDMVSYINVYINGELSGTVYETDEHVEGFFDIMRAETLRAVKVGHLGDANVAKGEYDSYHLKVSAGKPMGSVKGTVTVDKEFCKTGDIITATINLFNDSGRKQDVTIVAKHSAQLAPVTGDLAVSIEDGDTLELKQTFRAIQGGRPNLYVSVIANGKVLKESRQIISISGPGWYRGDSHSHSKYSDGAGTIAQNSESAYTKGLSWLYSTDHNNIDQWKESAAVNASYVNGDFFNIGGIEYTTENRGHSLGFRLDHEAMEEDYPGKGFWNGGWRISGLGSSYQDYQDVIDYNNAMGGIFYAAHPNDYVKIYENVVYRFYDVYNVTGMTGVEVWNAARHIKHPTNQGAFKIWDTLNVRGDKLFGISNSDGHGLPAIGANHIKGYLTDLSVENIDNLLESGHYYGTNGPDVYIDVNGVGMGDILKIKTDSVNGKITVRAQDDNYPLTKVTLYKLHETGTISDKAAEVIEKDCSGNGAYWMCDTNTYVDTKEVLKEWDLTGQNVYSFSEVVELTINDDDFFRVEVESEKNTFYDGFVSANADNIGFAYSNPVWVEKMTATNDIIISDMTVKGGKVVETTNGAYYVQLDDANTVLKADDLTVTMDGTAKLTAKTYNDEGKVFSLTFTTGDGATKDMTIYVMAQADAGFDYSTVYPTDTPATTPDELVDEKTPVVDEPEDDNTGDDTTGGDNAGDTDADDDFGDFFGDGSYGDGSYGDDTTGGNAGNGGATSPDTGVTVAVAPFVLLVIGGAFALILRNKKVRTE
ncbi:MAG: CehA/McbA family metallohydrolase [Clostridia bacterium]|nr:CehA/McbA family metallohydrolase [Clostridia bacterium]